MTQKNIFYLLPVMVGFVIAYVGSLLLSEVQGFDIPDSVFSWAKDNDLDTLFMHLWEIFVVQFLGVGLLAFAVTFVFTAQRFNNWFYLALAIVVSEVIAVHIVFPAVSGDSINTGRLNGGLANIWNYAHELVVFACSGLAAFIGKKS